MPSRLGGDGGLVLCGRRRRTQPGERRDGQQDQHAAGDLHRSEHLAEDQPGDADADDRLDGEMTAVSAGPSRDSAAKKAVTATTVPISATPTSASHGPGSPGSCGLVAVPARTPSTTEPALSTTAEVANGPTPCTRLLTRMYVA